MIGGFNLLVGRKPSEVNDSSPQYRPGDLFAYRDEETGLYGVYRYAKCVESGGCSKGELQAFPAVASVTATSGTTKTIVKSGLTAGAYEGCLAYVQSDAGGAGAAPEGEIKRIKNNTTDTIYLEDDQEFSAAIANGDVVKVLRITQAEDSAASDNNTNEDLCGIAAADISENYYGFFFCAGVCTFAQTTASAGNSLKAGDKVLAAFSGAQELIVGKCIDVTANAGTGIVVVNFGVVPVELGS